MTCLGWLLALALVIGIRAPAQLTLPDAPGYVSNVIPVELSSSPPSLPLDSGRSDSDASRSAPPCVVLTTAGPAPPSPASTFISPAGPLPQQQEPCALNQNQIRPFVDASRAVRPLSVEQKAHLAIHDIKDPFNLLTIAGTSAYFIASTPHSPYGPGLHGFGYNAGISLLQDATGETIGTFALSSLFHEDPRYFRMPHASIPRRIVHAVSRVAIAQGDDGRPMPNYANLLGSPICAEISNLYVPGIATDARSTTERIFSGFVTEPIGTLIAEFLPDVASHIHIRVVVVQRLLNQISAQPPQAGPVPGSPGSPGTAGAP
jgi:hypothetical protein